MSFLGSASRLAHDSRREHKISLLATVNCWCESADRVSGGRDHCYESSETVIMLGMTNLGVMGTLSVNVVLINTRRKLSLPQ